MFKNRLKKVFNIIRTVFIESFNLNNIVIVIDAGSLIEENAKIYKESTKLV